MEAQPICGQKPVKIMCACSSPDTNLQGELIFRAQIISTDLFKNGDSVSIYRDLAVLCKTCYLNIPDYLLDSIKRERIESQIQLLNY